MQKTRDYLTLKGWKVDLEETAKDFKDIGILVKRALGLSYKYGRYGFEESGEMTSRELEADVIRPVPDRDYGFLTADVVNSIGQAILDDIVAQQERCLPLYQYRSPKRRDYCSPRTSN